jgi:hypothetical protein
MLSTNTVKGRSGMAIRFTEWVPFDRALDYADEKTGIYEIRMKDGKKFGRVRGESDIVYIGSTTKSFKSRFRGYMKPDRSQKTNQHVKWFSTKYELEVAFLPIEKPKFYESLLIDAYIADHDELPPLNHQSIDKFHF